MIFTETPLSGAFAIDQERRADERGYFTRVFCSREFLAHGLEDRFIQSNISMTRRKGSIRGLHLQWRPHQEVKLVRCPRGSLFDVIVDLRPASPTFGRWFGAELSAQNGRMMYVPRGFAHGFQTLEDDVEISYQVSAEYAPHAEGGLRFDDSTVGIDWPLPGASVSERDRALPEFTIVARQAQDAEAATAGT
jgi:dTDP-4-dehydrorhamnose 3,5-epimerase